MSSGIGQAHFSNTQDQVVTPADDTLYRQAIQVLSKMGYRSGDELNPVPNIVTGFPSFSRQERSLSELVQFNPETWMGVWDLLMRAATHDSNQKDAKFMHTLRAVAAAVLYRHGVYLNFRCAHAFSDKDKVDLARFSQRFLDLLVDVRLLYGKIPDPAIERSWKEFLNAHLNAILSHRKVDEASLRSRVKLLYPAHVPSSEDLDKVPVPAFKVIQGLYAKYKNARLNDLE